MQSSTQAAIDAIAVDIGVANYQLKGREGFVKLDESLNSEQYAVGFKLGNTELRDKVNADLESSLKTELSRSLLKSMRSQT